MVAKPDVNPNLSAVQAKPGPYIGNESLSGQSESFDPTGRHVNTTAAAPLAWAVSLHRVAPGGNFDRTGDHWDWFFLDPAKPPGRQLRTWSTAPLGDRWSVAYAIDCPATPLADHRTIYLRHAGPVGGGRGEITPLLGGTYQSLLGGPLGALGGGTLRLQLDRPAFGDAVRLRFYRTKGRDRLRITLD